MVVFGDCVVSGAVCTLLDSDIRKFWSRFRSWFVV